MLDNPKANKFLYVPFNHEYSVPFELQKSLTNTEFFDNCYYDPDFDEKIMEIKTMDDEGNLNLNYPIDRTQMIENYKKQKKAKERFFDWINNNDVGVYCITGDAGTGKSTFLHYLAYNKYGDSIWNFLDLQSAHTPIILMNCRISFCNFEYLQQKLSSTLISNIIARLYVKDSQHQYDYSIIKENIFKLLSFYFKYIDELYPREQIRVLFHDLNDIDKELDNRDYCEMGSQVLYSFFDSMAQDYLDQNNTSEILMEIYLIILRTLNFDKKNIVVFDNLERFIGVDEIYNDQIYGFLKKLRGIFDNYDKNYKNEHDNSSVFSKCFQFIVAMRHTTTRMFIPQQNSDFVEHMSNLSDWFAIDEIVSLKEKWLSEHGFIEKDNERLMRILCDKGVSTNVISGLRLKLDLLFNNNKRLMLDFLFSTLENDDYDDALNKADELLNNSRLPTHIARYAYRTIIWRLVIDKLLNDDLFVDHFSNNGLDLFSNFDYMRKILIILSNYSLDHRYGYMNFEELLSRLYPHRHDISNWFYSEGCIKERRRIYCLLYFMNYYCRRDNNWFQFVDIQCNSQAINEIRFKDAETFVETFTNNVLPKDINIQITTTGKAYLGYVAHTFEFISSAYENNPQVLLNIPSEKEIRKENFHELECVKIIRKVIDKSKLICDQIDEDLNSGYEIMYKKNSNKTFSYSQIITRSVGGYIDNFCECIKHLYPVEDRSFIRKRDKLIKEIQNLRDDLVKKGSKGV